jgi:DNA-binding GntR family transcriptional regulator
MAATAAPLPPTPVSSRGTSPQVPHLAYARLRSAIADLVLQPGQPLTEAALADWLGLGRTPVREALLRLRDEGLVDVIPRKGYFVSRISADDAEEIYEVLEGLESMAVNLAARRASPDDVRRLEEAVRRQEEALAADDLDAWVTADEAFHQAVLEIAGNQRIRRIIEPLNAQLHRLRVLTVRMRPKPVRSTEEHRAVLAAIKDGNGALAFSLHQAHRSAARTVMMSAIRSVAGPNGGL